MIELLPAAYFKPLDTPGHGALVHPDGSVTPVYSVAMARAVLREWLKTGAITEPNFECVREALESSTLPYDDKDTDPHVKIDVLASAIMELQDDVRELKRNAPTRAPVLNSWDDEQGLLHATARSSKLVN